MKEYSLFWIKPDAFNPNNPRSEYDKLKKDLPENPYDFISYVISRLKDNDFEIVKEKEYKLDIETAERHYEEHRNSFSPVFKERTFDTLVEYMASGNSYWIIFYWEDAVKKGREILSDIRNEYLVIPKCRYNMTHAADSIESANREIMIHFPEITSKLNNNILN